MSKTKTAITFTSVFTKIIFAIVGLAIIVTLVFLITKCANNSKKDYYECTKYEITYEVGTNPQPEDRLSSFDYYRLYLNSDKTFTIKYCMKEDDTERIETGTYEKNGNEYTLTYNGTPIQEYLSVVHYKLENGKLTRNEQGKTTTSVNCKIVQEFGK